MDDPYEKLANAIIVQAAVDYKAETKKLKRLLANEPPPDPEDERSEEDKKGRRKIRGPHEKWEDKVFACEDETESIKRFFLSQWFEALSDLDGAWLLRKIGEEAEAT